MQLASFIGCQSQTITRTTHNPAHALALQSRPACISRASTTRSDCCRLTTEAKARASFRSNTKPYAANLPLDQGRMFGAASHLACSPCTRVIWPLSLVHQAHMAPHTRVAYLAAMQTLVPPQSHSAMSDGRFLPRTKDTEHPCSAAVPLKHMQEKDCIDAVTVW